MGRIIQHISGLLIWLLPVSPAFAQAQPIDAIGDEAVYAFSQQGGEGPSTLTIRRTKTGAFTLTRRLPDWKLPRTSPVTRPRRSGSLLSAVYPAAVGITMRLGDAGEARSVRAHYVLTPAGGRIREVMVRADGRSVRRTGRLIRSRRRRTTPRGPVIEEARLLRLSGRPDLFLQRVRPEAAPHGRLAWVHGAAEHGGRYLATLRWFAARGWDSTIVNLRGHGHSEGTRLYVKRFGEYLDDVEVLLKQVCVDRSKTPLFLIGHSMGGLVVTRTLQTRRARLPALKGAVLLSPYFKLKMEVPAWKVKLGQVLSERWPTFSVPTDIDLNTLSSDPAARKAYAADPLVSTKATARWFTETTSAQALALEQAKTLRLELLILHGADDGLADPAAAAEFHSRLPGPNRTLRTWPGSRHELLNDADQAEVREALLAWLAARR